MVDDEKQMDGWLRRIVTAKKPPRFETLGLSFCKPDWGFADRKLVEHLVYLILENEMVGEVSIGGGEAVSIRLCPGDLLWMLPGTRHTFANADAARPITVYFTRIELPKIRHRENLVGSCFGDMGCDEERGGDWGLVVSNAWEVTGVFDRIIDEHAAEMRYRGFRIQADTASLFTDILRIASRGAGGEAVLTRAQRKRIYELSREAMSERLSSADLAAELRLSQDYFTRVFRRTFGVPPRRWLMEQRIRQAALRLDGSMLDVGEIARELGYPNLFLFSRQFKSVIGQSPRAYRRRDG